MPLRVHGQLTFARSPQKQSKPAFTGHIWQAMLTAVIFGNYHRGSWRLATHGRLSSLRAAGTALEPQSSSIIEFDMYLRIMKYLRGRAELRHNRIAPTGWLRDLCNGCGAVVSSLCNCVCVGTKLNTGVNREYHVKARMNVYLILNSGGPETSVREASSRVHGHLDFVGPRA